MGLRYRSSFKLFPGVRLNLSKSGVSASFGVPGATLNLGPRGARATIGVPGTGLSYSTQLNGGGKSPAPSWPEREIQTYNPSLDTIPQVRPSVPSFKSGVTRTIASADIEQRTSEGLQSLKDMLVEARRQRREVDDDLSQASGLLAAQKSELLKRRSSILRFFFKKRIDALAQALPDTQAEIERLQSWSEATRIDMTFNIGDEAQRTYGALVDAFNSLANSAMVWDVTTESDVDRKTERSAASTAVTRKPVKLSFSDHDLVRFSGSAMRFQNTNGEDILLYPALALTPRADGAFALVDIRDLKVTFRHAQFIEQDKVPADAQVVGQAWFKANRDGSPDRRFKGNYQIPICIYGDLTFSSETGLLEGYSISNATAAQVFTAALNAHRSALALAAP